MVRETGLHLISKMRSDVALYLPLSGDLRKKRGPKPKQGDKIDVRALSDKYRKQTTTEDDLRTEIFQQIARLGAIHPVSQPVSSQ